MMSGRLAIPDRYLRIIIQLALVGSAAIVTFGYPALFGLEVYGLFAMTTAATFIVQRIVDLMAESIIANRQPRMLVGLSLTIAVSLALAYLAAQWLTPSLPPFDLRLYIAVVLSTIVLNLGFQVGTVNEQAVYAIGFATLNLAVTALWVVYGLSDLALAMAVINFGGFLVGSALFFRKLRREPVAEVDEKAQLSTKEHVAVLPWRLGMASLPIFVAYGTILVAQPNLRPAEIGELRLLATIAMMGTSITPINPKAFYALFADTGTPTDLIAFIKGSAVPIGIALAGWVALVGAVLLTNAVDQHLFWIGIATYPAVLFGAAFDKVLLFQRGLKRLGGLILAYTALLAAAIVLQSTLIATVISIAALLALYPMIAALVLDRRFLKIAALASGLSLIAALPLIALAVTDYGDHSRRPEMHKGNV